MLSWVDDDTPLPSTHLALGEGSDAPGLLAAGGGLGTARLEEAYRKGVFPWFGPGQPVLWWCPDPRMVLHTAEFRLKRSLAKSLRRFLRTPGNELRFDSAFDQVIEACASTPREGQGGTWIVAPMIAAYQAWHRAGRVHSVETWENGQLIGGLYFIAIGRMCFGESMFSRRSDASKFALAALVAACRARGIEVIDCQQNTQHLAALGAREISRQAFEAHLSRTLGAPEPEAWTYDGAAWRHLPLTGADRHAANEAP